MLLLALHVSGELCRAVPPQGPQSHMLRSAAPPLAYVTFFPSFFSFTLVFFLV